MSVRSKSTIFNAALLRTGHSETTTGPLFRAMDANYDEIVRDCFEQGNGVFSFGKRRVVLGSRTDGVFGYGDAYVMPTDVIQVIEVFLDKYAASDLLEPWEIVDGKLAVNAYGRVVEVEYVGNAQEHTWSASFAKAVQMRLEAVIKDVLEETQEALAKDSDAEMQILKAGVAASKERSSRPVWKRGGGRLIRARRTPKPGYRSIGSND